MFGRIGALLSVHLLISILLATGCESNHTRQRAQDDDAEDARANLAQRLQEEEQQRTATWRKNYADILKYRDSQVELEILDIRFSKYSTDYHLGLMMGTVVRTELVIKVTAISEGRILSLWNQWPHFNELNGGWFSSDGVYLRDSLGNELKLLSIKPAYTSSYPKSLHFGDTEEFTVVFADYPVPTATSVLLEFSPEQFGLYYDRRSLTLPRNVFELPTSVFLKDRQDQEIEELFSHNP